MHTGRPITFDLRHYAPESRILLTDMRRHAVFVQRGPMMMMLSVTSHRCREEPQRHGRQQDADSDQQEPEPPTSDPARITRLDRCRRCTYGGMRHFTFDSNQGHDDDDDDDDCRFVKRITQDASTALTKVTMSLHNHN